MGPVREKAALAAETLLKTDSVAFTATADKEGRIRLLCASWEDPKVLLPGQALELRWIAGQVVMTRRVVSGGEKMRRGKAVIASDRAGRP